MHVTYVIHCIFRHHSDLSVCEVWVSCIPIDGKEAFILSRQYLVHPSREARLLQNSAHRDADACNLDTSLHAIP